MIQKSSPAKFDVWASLLFCFLGFLIETPTGLELGMAGSGFVIAGLEETNSSEFVGFGCASSLCSTCSETMAAASDDPGRLSRTTWSDFLLPVGGLAGLSVNAEHQKLSHTI